MAEIFQARFARIIFGEGQEGLLIKKRLCGQDEYGVDMVEVIIRPSPEMIQFYEFDEATDLNAFGEITRRFPSKLILPLLIDPTFGAYLILCTWDWEDSNLTRHYPATELLEDYEKHILTLKKENATLHQEISALMSNRLKYVKDWGAIVKEINSFKGKTSLEEEYAAQQESEQGGYSHE